jgi:hypothetical protein
VRRSDRFISRLRDIQLYGERAKKTVRDRSLGDMEPVELDALCYLVLIVSEATIQALGLDEELAQRHPESKRGLRAVWRTRFGFTMMEETRFPS